MSQYGPFNPAKLFLLKIRLNHPLPLPPPRFSLVFCSLCSFSFFLTLTRVLRSFRAIFELLVLLPLQVLIVVVVLLILSTLMVMLHFCAPDFHWSAPPLCFHRIQGLLLSLRLVIITLPFSPWPFSATSSNRHGQPCRRGKAVRRKSREGRAWKEGGGWWVGY